MQIPLLPPLARLRAPVTALIGVAFFATAACDRSEPPRLKLATTTSTRDSGLLDAILPRFEKAHGVRVDVIAVGTGKALKLGEAGDVDVVLVHARAAEEAFMAAGHGARREAVMANRFELLGPPADPAGIRGLDPIAALKRIAVAGAPFVSRGDDSGTHKKELALWKAAGGLIPWPSYVETGQGMGQTLTVADQKLAYTLADRGTFLAFRDKIELRPLAADAEIMENPYGVMTVNPARHPHVDAARADLLVDYLLAPETQAAIAAFRVAGEPLFTPAGAGAN